MKKYLVFIFLFFGLAFIGRLGLNAKDIEDKDSISDKLMGDNKKDTAQINLTLSLSFDFITRNSELSLKYAFDALELSTQIGYVQGMCNAERYIGDNYSSQAEYPTALQHLLRALILSNESKTIFTKALVLNDLGELYVNLQQYDKAIEYYSKAEDLVRKQNPDFVLMVKSNLANAYQKAGDNQKAEIFAMDVLSKALLKKDIGLQADSYSTIARTYQSKNKYSEARINFQKAYLLFEKIQDEEAKLLVLQSLGEVELAMQNPATATQNFEKVISQAKRCGLNYMIAINYKKLSEVDSFTGDFENALLHYKRYILLKDSAESVEKSMQMNKINAHNDMENKQKNIEQLIVERNKQETNLKWKNAMLVFFFILIPLLVVLSSLLFYNYNQKRTINQELSKQKEALQTLNSVKDRLFSIISHDLRTPLANLESILKLMENGDLSQEEVIMLSGQLTQNVHETSNMLDNLLQWSKTQMKGILPKIESIHLTPIAIEVIRFFHNQAEKKAIEIKISDPENLSAMADKEMIRLVLRNLVANSIKFTPTGGKITVEIKSKERQIFVSVIDTGIGMNEKVQSKLFSLESIITEGTQNEKGTGLGLILCKDFVEINHGKIWAQGEIGKGSTFVFSLPLSDKPSKTILKGIREKTV